MGWLLPSNPKMVVLNLGVFGYFILLGSKILFWTLKNLIWRFSKLQTPQNVNVNINIHVSWRKVNYFIFNSGYLKNLDTYQDFCCFKVSDRVLRAVHNGCPELNDLLLYDTSPNEMTVIRQHNKNKHKHRGNSPQYTLWRPLAFSGRSNIRAFLTSSQNKKRHPSSPRPRVSVWRPPMALWWPMPYFWVVF